MRVFLDSYRRKFRFAWALIGWQLVLCCVNHSPPHIAEVAKIALVRDDTSASPNESSCSPTEMFPVVWWIVRDCLMVDLYLRPKNFAYFLGEICVNFLERLWYFSSKAVVFNKKIDLSFLVFCSTKERWNTVFLPNQKIKTIDNTNCLILKYQKISIFPKVVNFALFSWKGIFRISVPTYQEAYAGLFKEHSLDFLLNDIYYCTHWL